MDVRTLIGLSLAVLMQVNGGPAMPVGGSERSMSGIEGQISYGPTSPVARAGVPNFRPIAATITVLDTQGNVVDHIVAGPDGRFRAELPPGTYKLHPEPSEGHDRVADRIVTVKPGAMVKIGINYDSGMR